MTELHSFTGDFCDCQCPRQRHGKKSEPKVYRRHSGRPGSMKGKKLKPNFAKLQTGYQDRYRAGRQGMLQKYLRQTTVYQAESVRRAQASSPGSKAHVPRTSNHSQEDNVMQVTSQTGRASCRARASSNLRCSGPAGSWRQPNVGQR